MLAAMASALLTSVVLTAFIGGVKRGVAALIIIRPLCDRLFEQARFEVAGHDLSYGAILNFVVIAAMLLSLQRIDNKVQIILERAWLPFLLLALAAVLYSPVELDAFRKFLTYVSYMAMFILPFAIVKTRGSAEWFFKLIILSSVLPVLYGLFELVSGLDWYQGGRIESTFTHPNIFSFYLLTTIGTILTLLCSNRVRLTDRARTVLACYLLPLLVLLVMTKTRSAWAACLFLFIVYGAIQDKRVLVLSLVLPILALALPGVRERLTALASGNEYVGWVQNVNPYAWRQILWQRAFPLILQRPVFGYGLYSFPYYSPTFFPLEFDTRRGRPQCLHTAIVRDGDCRAGCVSLDLLAQIHAIVPVSGVRQTGRDDGRGYGGWLSHHLLFRQSSGVCLLRLVLLVHRRPDLRRPFAIPQQCVVSGPQSGHRISRRGRACSEGVIRIGGPIWRVSAAPGHS